MRRRFQADWGGGGRQLVKTQDVRRLATLLDPIPPRVAPMVVAEGRIELKVKGRNESGDGASTCPITL